MVKIGLLLVKSFSFYKINTICYIIPHLKAQGRTHMNHLEIEFKTLLTKDEYNRLAMLFSHVTPVTQTNYYIDTPQSDMRSKKLSLRIRTLPLMVS